MPLIQDGRPDPNLLTLCRKFGVNVPDDVSPIVLNDQLQETWLRAGYLRYQIKGEPPSDEDWELLKRLGFIEAVPPPNTLRYTWAGGVEVDQRIHYTGALLLGALRSRVVSRLHYLTQFAERLTFGIVNLLGGARPLDSVKESREVLCTPAELPFKEGWAPPDDIPTTEAGMMKLVIEQSVLSMRWDYYVVDAALQPKDPTNPESEKRPPNTAETVRTLFDPEFHRQTNGALCLYYRGTWVQCNPLAEQLRGTFLAVSNQPYVENQRLAVQRVVLPGTTVVGCGHAASRTLPLPTFLDNIAKQLFEELRARSQA